LGALASGDAYGRGGRDRFGAVIGFVEVAVPARPPPPDTSRWVAC